MRSIEATQVGEFHALLDEKLPEGWAQSSLEDILVYALGGEWGEPCTDPRSPGTVRVNVIRGTEFRNWDSEKGATAAERLIHKSSLSKRQLQVGDIIVEISGGGPDQPVGRTILMDDQAIQRTTNPLICSNFCRQIRLYPVLDPAFINLALRYQYTLGGFNAYQTQTTNIRNLNFGDFITNVTIPLPPLSEQKRIVAKVEALLTRVNAARERLARVPPILKRFGQAVLAAACSGRLTEEWRTVHPDAESAQDLLKRIREEKYRLWSKDHLSRSLTITEPNPALDDVDVPESWAIVSMDQLTCLVTSGSRGWAKYYADSGPLFIRAQDINSDEFRLNNVAHVRLPNNAEGQRTRVHRGDLLVTITGANVTRSALVEVELDEAYVSQHVALVRPVDPSIGKYLFLWTISPLHGRAKLLNDAYGAGKPGLNLDNIKEMTVALPSLPEQHEIIRRVEALFKLADTIEKRVAGGTARAEKLTQAILAKAFRGELVPTEAELARREGRGYEPAAVLLARVRAERGTATETARGKGKSKKNGAQQAAPLQARMRSGYEV